MSFWRLVQNRGYEPLESDAKDKLCPFKMNREAMHGSFACNGPACMAWEIWTEPDRDGEGKIIGPKPKEPPQGHCGMIPPELNCTYP